MKSNNLEKLLIENFQQFINHWKNTNREGILADTLIVSISDGYKRAKVITPTINKGDMIEKDGQRILEMLLSKLKWATSQFDNPLKWLRIEWVSTEKEFTWKDFNQELRRYKRNYFRSGIAFEGKTKPWCLLTEMELNANACLYAGNDVSYAKANLKNLNKYIKSRHSSNNLPSFDDEMTLIVFNTEGVFLDASTGEFIEIESKPRNKGRRIMLPLNSDSIQPIISQSACYLANQVQPTGKYVYGYFPCFNRTINTYNALRHASSTYALIEGYEACKKFNILSVQQLEEMLSQIDNALDYTANTLIRTYGYKSYVVDTGDEIKLGANAVAILAFVKYIQVFPSSDKNERYLSIANKLALGILDMQQDDGSFVHVLHSKDLTLKQKNRIIYYDGEAAFALMRLYGLTKDERWLNCVEKAFDYFIEAKHYRAHDHWLSYCSNELVLYKPERKYFQFAVDNIKGYTDFIKNRITTFPTLLELSMAFHKMLLKLDDYPEYHDVLEGFDVHDFYQALHARANYLLNGFFFPEVAMFFKAPNTILHGFFIRHHSFRVRIDDVEHYLSGLVAYAELLESQEYPAVLTANKDGVSSGTQAQIIKTIQNEPLEDIINNNKEICTIAWGGDVNLGRRQHYLTGRYGVTNTLKVPILAQADFALINLECVISTLGEQGRVKGEGGPYYYRARPEMVEVLRSSGINAVACANNHSGDYGTEALWQQQQILAAAGIASVGTGINKQAAFEPIYQQLNNGVRLAIFSVDATIKHFAATENIAGAAYIDPREHQLWTQTYTSLFKEAKNQADLILVAIHWGANGRATPDKDEYEIGHRLIEAGADAILGASAHQLQGIEIYKGKPIIHDAGDLLFDAVVSKPKPGGVFQLDISQSGIERVRFYPVQVGFGQTWQAVGNIAIDASRQFASLCLAMDTDVTLHEDGSLSIPLDISATTYSKEQKSALKSEVLSDKGNISRLDSVDYSQWSAHSRTDLVMDTVPEDARIEPIVFGEMELVGVRTRPYFFNRRRMLWIESFWQINKVVSEDIRVHFRAVPTFKTDKMRPWGIGTDHDPCDWLIPTSKWEVGKIYRDFYGLRPSYKRAWEDGTLQLEVRTVNQQQSYPFFKLAFDYVLSTKKVQYAKELPSSLKYRQVFLDNVYENHTKGTWNAEQLASITGGKWLVKPNEDWYVDFLVAGSKHIKMAEGKVLFVANSNQDRATHENSSKPPKPFDRHVQIAANQDKLEGAIVSYPVKGLKPDFPILQVADPIKAWIELGIAARSRFKNPVVAVTGTVGKSSTCKMIATMFGSNKKVLTTLDNYNSRVGVPGALASLSPDHDAAVIEVAQSALWMQRGPITRFLKPDVSLLTELGLSQTQQIESLKQIADNKRKIFDGLSRDAIAVIGAHLPYFDDIYEYAKQHSKRVIIFGEHENAEVKLKDVDIDFKGSTVTLETAGNEFTFIIPIPSMGMVRNAIAAFTVMYALGHDLNVVINNLKLLEQEERRFELSLISIEQGRVSLFDDSYNAEYDSMVNAFELFKVQSNKKSSRYIYVLGRIVHLGDMAQTIHEALAQPLLDSSPDLIITHGDEMRYLRDKLPKHLLGEHFNNAQAAATYIKSLWQANDVILLKGSSRDSDFGSIGQLLKKGV